MIKAGVRALALGAILSSAPLFWAQSGTGTVSGSAPKSRVLFSRSTGETAEQATPTMEAKAPATAATTAGVPERQAVTFTAYDLDVHLQPGAGQIAVRALVTVRNDSRQMLKRIPLAISATLNWERIRVSNHAVEFPVATVNSDVDHTGQLHEALVPLAQPLPPGESQQLDISYAGAIPVSAERLTAIGTPAEAALRTDWDRISADFTGLRGFGNVLWYPTAAAPVLLGDGARLFDAMGEQRLRMAGAKFHLRLTVEYARGQAPTVAVVNGQAIELTGVESSSQPTPPEVDGVARGEFAERALGFELPSLFVAGRRPLKGANLTTWAREEDQADAELWNEAAQAVTPFLQGWLGQKPRAELTVLDLPEAGDQPFESGALLVAPLHVTDGRQLNGVLAHALTHAWMESPRAWLSEGVAHFMGTLWMEHARGREAALGALEAGRTALALAEPESPGEGTGQPLAQAISPVYYRTKAAYVFWMLRDIVGDQALSAALRGYDPAADSNRGLGPNSPAGSFEQLLESASLRHDLSWFFADWVNADRGLPELSLAGVYPSAAAAGNWLVAVDVANAGTAQAEVPITVRAGALSVTRRVRIPARGRLTERILIAGAPTEVQLNDGTTPETTSSLHRMKIDTATQPVPSPAAAPVEVDKRP